MREEERKGEAMRGEESKSKRCSGDDVGDLFGAAGGAYFMFRRQAALVKKPPPVPAYYGRL